MRYLLTFLLPVCLLAAERPVPPPGIAIPEAQRTALESGLRDLTAACERIKDHALAPDVLIFREAVRFALTHGEFFKADEFEKAKGLLKVGMERAAALAEGKAPWNEQTGLVVRGYRSKIDHSIQPYGLSIPKQVQSLWRVDAWFHGRGETLSEVNFLHERMTRPGEFSPAGTIMLYLYGRYCNANKFAGEVDLFEALADVKKHYRVDENRILVRGFSMGGAAAWQFAAHYPGHWAAAAPGAGFSETAEFLNVFQNEQVQVNWWEKKLWRMYDATEYALNFFNLPLVAYSGEIDKQKQAADIMARYLAKEGISMTHIIGPQTPHRYHPDSKVQIDRRLDAIAARGRDPYPRTVKFTTFTLAYHRMKWIVVDGLKEHWERGTIEASIVDGGVKATTKGITAFTLDFGPGGAPFAVDSKVMVQVDGMTLSAPAPMSDRSLRVHLRQAGGRWMVVNTTEAKGLQKMHRLQGPIDDAFLDSFIFVVPTGAPIQPRVGEHLQREQERAIREWRKQFRGDARVKTDTEITESDIASANLVLWGDPGSNKLLARISSQLPIPWTAEKAGTFPAATNYPSYIYPNPLNTKRYIVLNSGFTFREYDYLNNARQISKLPDWAVVDVTTDSDGRWPGKIAHAGFFDEQWRMKPQ